VHELLFPKQLTVATWHHHSLVSYISVPLQGPKGTRKKRCPRNAKWKTCITKTCRVQRSRYKYTNILTFHFISFHCIALHAYIIHNT
jgi:hypothetical protein